VRPLDGVATQGSRFLVCRVSRRLLTQPAEQLGPRRREATVAALRARRLGGRCDVVVRVDERPDPDGAGRGQLCAHLRHDIEVGSVDQVAPHELFHRLGEGTIGEDRPLVLAPQGVLLAQTSSSPGPISDVSPPR